MSSLVRFVKHFNGTSSVVVWSFRACCLSEYENAFLGLRTTGWNGTNGFSYMDVYQFLATLVKRLKPMSATPTSLEQSRAIAKSYKPMHVLNLWPATCPETCTPLYTRAKYMKSSETCNFPKLLLPNPDSGFFRNCSSGSFRGSVLGWVWQVRGHVLGCSLKALFPRLR